MSSPAGWFSRTHTAAPLVIVALRVGVSASIVSQFDGGGRSSLSPRETISIALSAPYACASRFT